MQNSDLNNKIPLKLIQIRICQACLDGIGQECHTPGCALFLHKVDLPIHEGLYEVINDSPTQPEIKESLSTVNSESPLADNGLKNCCMKAIEEYKIIFFCDCDNKPSQDKPFSGYMTSTPKIKEDRQEVCIKAYLGQHGVVGCCCYRCKPTTSNCEHEWSVPATGNGYMCCMKEGCNAYTFNQPSPSISKEQEINLTQEFSGAVWAKEFSKMYPMILKDGEGAMPSEEVMLTWFCNAIMAGYDHANRKAG